MFRRFSEQPIRLPNLFPRAYREDDPRIFAFNAERADVVSETVRRAIEPARKTRASLEQALAEAAFHEAKRLESQDDEETAERLSYFRTLLRRIAKMSVHELETELEVLATRMAWDVAGNFDPRVYDVVKTAIPRVITAVMRPSLLPRALFTLDGTEVLSAMLTVEGDLDHLRRLEKRATMLYVPTHSSNLDSVVLGQALVVSGLAPVMYGAGKNLFTNPVLAFFMHNLGAYRVDRRVKTNLYKDVLKTYAREVTRRGYHGLFFPGGTRSRSNLVESRLKLGLAGSALEAFAERRVDGNTTPIVFVPTTINYALTLEAETLIDDWLVEEGKSRYIIDDDESTRLDRYVDFFKKLVGLRAACVIRFGTPLDPFGNPVSPEGHSLGPNGRFVDPGTYVMSRGVPIIDPARDAAYTRELGDQLAGIYRRETVIMPTQLVAHVLFRRLVRESPGLDLFARLRLRNEIRMRHDELAEDVGATRDRLAALVARGAVHATEALLNERPNVLVERSIEIWNGYHRRIAARGEGVDVVIDDPTLLLYYQNRLVPYALELASPDDAEAARFVASIGARR